jgi:hypothetical protein
MVLAAPGLLLTPPPSSSPPKTPHRSYSAQIQSAASRHRTGRSRSQLNYSLLDNTLQGLFTSIRAMHARACACAHTSTHPCTHVAALNQTSLLSQSTHPVAGTGAYPSSSPTDAEVL